MPDPLDPMDSLIFNEKCDQAEMKVLDILDTFQDPNKKTAFAFILVCQLLRGLSDGATPYIREQMMKRIKSQVPSLFS